jgi:hypothetical protein
MFSCRHKTNKLIDDLELDLILRSVTYFVRLIVFAKWKIDPCYTLSYAFGADPLRPLQYAFLVSLYIFKNVAGHTIVEFGR